MSGPGVIDMKGGLVAAVYAIKALAACDLLADIPLTLLCNSDEEIGSPSSTALFQAEARRSVAALGFECGGLGGEVVTGRKGRSGYRLIVTGRAGHAASAGADKASAILELAHKTIALEGLNDSRRGIVVNVGLIQGGIGPNTVSDHAAAEIDTRFLTRTDAEETAARLAEIASRSTVAGTTAALQYVGGRPPMEQNDRNSGLFQVIRAEAERLGSALCGGTAQRRVRCQHHRPARHPGGRRDGPDRRWRPQRPGVYAPAQPAGPGPPRRLQYPEHPGSGPQVQLTYHSGGGERCHATGTGSFQPAQ